jgi:streptomycin 6-kinase
VTSIDVQQRSRDLIRAWNISVDVTSETDTSVLMFGTRNREPVVLKVVKREGEEWHSGEVMAAFGGHATARVHEYVPGAVLLERAMPGDTLVQIAIDRDEDATSILVDLITRMSHCRAPARCPTVEDWGSSFARYSATGDARIAADLVETGSRLYAELAASQASAHLLHGDLQHYNILSDAHRGWLAIDPKGVVGEAAYEAGASLRNPAESPDLFTSAKTIERRAHEFARGLNVDVERILGWAFAQAVLSAIWLIEDGFAVDAKTPVILLADTLHEMLA